MELTDVTHVASGRAEQLEEMGIETVEDLAHANPYDVFLMEGIGARRAEQIVSAAVETLQEEYDNLQYDPFEDRYYDAGFDTYTCVCGKTLGDHNQYNVHINRCPTVERAEELQTAFIKTDNKPENFGLCDTEECEELSAYKAAHGETVFQYCPAHFDEMYTYSS